MSDNNALNQAKAQYDSIAAMVAAFNVDYDRLEELKSELEGACEDQSEDNNFGDFVRSQSQDESAVFHDIAQEYQALMIDAEGYEDTDEARERIQDDALDVQVNYGWHTPGNFQGDVKPEEFMILLCTGGPAVRIMGELDDNMTPCRAWIEYQDWGTPWTMLDSMYVKQSTLLEYC